MTTKKEKALKRKKALKKPKQKRISLYIGKGEFRVKEGSVPPSLIEGSEEEIAGYA